MRCSHITHIMDYYPKILEGALPLILGNSFKIFSKLLNSKLTWDKLIYKWLSAYKHTAEIFIILVTSMPYVKWIKHCIILQQMKLTVCSLLKTDAAAYFTVCSSRLPFFNHLVSLSTFYHFYKTHRNFTKWKSKVLLHLFLWGEELKFFSASSKDEYLRNFNCLISSVINQLPAEFFYMD